MDSLPVRVLVIGANGQDGRIVCTHFRNLGIETLGISQGPSKIGDDSNFVRICDLSDFKTAIHLLDGFMPTHIFHLAAVHGSSSTMQEVEDTSRIRMLKCHVGIVENLISWARLNESVKIVVGLSSQMYTPTNQIEMVSESTIPHPQNYYGETKLQSFNLLRHARYNFGIQIAGAILFNHSSEYSKPEFLFPQLAQQLFRYHLGRTDQIVVRNSSARITMGDAREFCDALIRICFAEKSDDYIISFPALITIEQLIANASQLLGNKKLPTVVSETQEHQKSVLLGDIKKANAELNWYPLISPEVLLAEMTRKTTY